MPNHAMRLIRASFTRRVNKASPKRVDSGIFNPVRGSLTNRTTALDASSRIDADVDASIARRDVHADRAARITPRSRRRPAPIVIFDIRAPSFSSSSLSFPTSRARGRRHASFAYHDDASRAAPRVVVVVVVVVAGAMRRLTRSRRARVPLARTRPIATRNTHVDLVTPPASSRDSC